jgi:hypothetical protein
LSVAHSPFVVVYRIRSRALRVEIVRFLHERERR